MFNSHSSNEQVDLSAQFWNDVESDGNHSLAKSPTLIYPPGIVLSREGLNSMDQTALATDIISYEGHTQSPSDPLLRLNKALPERPRSIRSGWHMGVVCGCACTILALICNFVLVAWARNSPLDESNTRILWSGDCSRMKTVNTWSHFGINILSTLILSSSNYAMQVLAAPTRKQIDFAHSRRRSLNIGIPSLSNWAYVEWPQRLLAIGLLLTSIPLHLFYNSTIFSTTTAVNYDLILANSSLQNISPIMEETTYLDSSTNTTVWSSMYNNQLINMTAEDCWNTFSTDFVAGYSWVLLHITNRSIPSNCMSTYSRNSSFRSDFPSCAQSSTCPEWWSSTQPSAWTFNLDKKQTLIPYWFNPDYPNNACQFGIEFCLALPFDAHCTVHLVPDFLYTVIICNVIKIVLLLLLLNLNLVPLITVGDAIVSFMDDPDPTTEGLGAFSAVDLGGGAKSINEIKRLRGGIWKPHPREYVYGATKARWQLGLGLSGAYWIISLIWRSISCEANTTVTLHDQWKSGFGTIIPSMVARDPNMSIQTLAIVVNTPQIILSLVYVFYNALVTSLVLTREWVRFSTHKKSLRVTRPEGLQRSSYFLSLPYKFSIPLLTISILLHWTLSQSLFLVQANVVNPDGSFVSAASVHSVGWSTLSILLFVILQTIAVLIILFVAGLNTYSEGMPLAAGQSRVISAACHPSKGARSSRESIGKIQYGVIENLGNGKYHVGFTSGPVRPLVYGEWYV